MTQNQVLVELLRRIADTKNATPAQISLAWLLAQASWIVPIPGTTKLHRFKENFPSADIVLMESELTAIRTVLNSIEIKGERHPGDIMGTVGL